MALSNVNSITSAIAAGQAFKVGWNKTFGAAQVVNRWYNTFQMAGLPIAGTYGQAAMTIGATNAWSAYVASGIATIDTGYGATGVSHGMFVGQTFVTSAAWTTNPWMGALTRTVTAVPSPHQFQFSTQYLSATGWTLNGWGGTWAGGFTPPGNTNALTNSLTILNPNTYVITTTITGQSAGTLTITMGGQTSPAYAASGTYTWTPTTASAAALTLTPTAPFNGTVVISMVQNNQAWTTESSTTSVITPTNTATAIQLYGNAQSCLSSWGGAFNVGRINCGESVSPLNKHLTNIEIMSPTASSTPAYLILVDLLVVYPGLNPQVAATTTLLGNNGSSTLPRYSSGLGVQAFIEVTTTTGAGAQTVAINYANSNGTAGQVTPTAQGLVLGYPTSGVQAVMYSGSGGTATTNFNTGPFMPLAAGDQGIQYVSSLTFTGTSAAGTVALVLCKPLAAIPVATNTAAGFVATARDYIFNMPSFPRIYDGACLAFLCYTSGTSTPTLYGTLDFVWG